MGPPSRCLRILLVAGIFLLPGVGFADKLDCKNHKAAGEGPAPASLSENSSLCSMTFGNNNSATGNALLNDVLQKAPQDARKLGFSEGRVREFRPPFNVTGPFDQAVVFFQALRVIDPLRRETNAADALDALFYVMAGSAAAGHAEAYRMLLEKYWDIRSTLASSLKAPLELLAGREVTRHSFGSLTLFFGEGCLIANIGDTRFVASIAQSLRTDFRSCGRSAA